MDSRDEETSVREGQPGGQQESYAEPGTVPTGPDAGEGRSKLRPLLVEILQTALLTLLIFFAVRSVVQNFKVDGASMEPTLHSGQYLLISKVDYARVEGLPLQVAREIGLLSGTEESVYLFGGPQRGDIVVFHYPARPDRDFIKRIIALPGDVVEVNNGRVYVNDVLLEEDYVRALPSYSLPPQRVPEGSFFVLGDNRPNSSDSHIWGFVPESNVIGKAWLSYWPPSDWGIVANRGLAGN